MPSNRKNSSANPDEDSDLKKSIECLQKDVTKLLNQQGDFLAIIEKLEKENKQKDQHISDLELRIDNLEQYTRAENFIISNLEIKPSSYSDSIKRGTNNEITIEDDNSVENQVVDFLQKNGIAIEKSEISTCHQLGITTPKKPYKDIIVRCVSRKSKAKVMYKVKKEKVLKTTNVHINDHLTKKNNELAAIGRRLRKKEEITNTWVRDGRVFIRTKGRSPEEEKTIPIFEKKTYREHGFVIDNLFVN